MNRFIENEGKFPKLENFIRELINNSVPLNYIDKNDWESNCSPSVYIHNKKNMFKLRRYSRASKTDLKQALKFFKDKNPVSFVR